MPDQSRDLGVTQPSDHRKILKAVLAHFVACEGTDYLKQKGVAEALPSLSAEENAELTNIRDEVRAEIGWVGYP